MRQCIRLAKQVLSVKPGIFNLMVVPVSVYSRGEARETSCCYERF